MAYSYCDRCGKRTAETVLWHVQILSASHTSPAEYEWRCLRPSCAPPTDRSDMDEAYERAAARYDGEGKDWR
jgi:hypothetical protein